MYQKNTVHARPGHASGASGRFGRAKARRGISDAPGVKCGDFVSQALLVFQNPVLRLVRPSEGQLDFRELHSVPHDLQPRPPPTCVVDSYGANVRERDAERATIRACVSQESVLDDERLSSEYAADAVLLLIVRHDDVEKEVMRSA